MEKSKRFKDFILGPFDWWTWGSGFKKLFEWTRFISRSWFLLLESLASSLGLWELTWTIFTVLVVRETDNQKGLLLYLYRPITSRNVARNIFFINSNLWGCFNSKFQTQLFFSGLSEFTSEMNIRKKFSIQILLIGNSLHGSEPLFLT